MCIPGAVTCYTCHRGHSLTQSWVYCLFKHYCKPLFIQVSFCTWLIHWRSYRNKQEKLFARFISFWLLFMKISVVYIIVNYVNKYWYKLYLIVKNTVHSMPHFCYACVLYLNWNLLFSSSRNYLFYIVLSGQLKRALRWEWS